jgi:predicted NAD-dependent protein-ADP-ribosyltransferase YbiA (DUF1768 family)
MAKEIKIFDPRDKPFGCLSNNYSNYVQGDKQLVAVIRTLNFGNGKPCKTLTNYIYASLLEKEPHKQIVCGSKPKEAKSKFDEQATIEKNDTITEAVKEALKSMFNQNTDLANLLLSTGDRKLFYISKTGDTFLGINQEKEGDNWYGLLLEQERQSLVSKTKTQQKQKNEENEKNIKYDAYLAQKALTDAIDKRGDDLKKYIGLSLDTILKNFNREDIARNLLSREIFLKGFPRNVSEQVASYVLDPTNMVHLIRKQFIRKLKQYKLKEIKKKIFYIYADYLLDKKGVNPADFKKAKEEQFSGQKFLEEADELQDRLYNLYIKGMLSERLSKDIDELLKRYHIPSDEEIYQAEKYEPPVKKDLVTQSYKYGSSNTDPIYILPSDAVTHEMYTKNSDYVCLSPDSVCKNLIQINGIKYLTVNHYIIEKLMLQLGVKDVHSSYILKPSSSTTTRGFRNLPDIVRDYEQLKTKFYKDKLIKYAKEGLTKKFLDDRVMQDYLLATGNSNLIYNDDKDPILGIGRDSNGDNEVGKYLMELRTTIIEKRKDEAFNLLTIGDINLVIDKNAFMKDWVTQRVKDSCGTIVTINDYVKEKFNTRISLSPKFVEAVLDNIYHPCSQIYGAVDQIKIQVPDYFINIVQNCVGMESASLEIIDVLWKRIAVIIYYLIIHLGEKGAKIQDISSQIGNVQVLKSKPIRCENIVSDEYENCIIVALVNLIIGIINFNLVNSMPKLKVTEVEVQAATSIILESIIPKIKPKEDGKEIEDVKDPKDGKEVPEDLTAPEYDLDEAIDEGIDEANKDNDVLKFEFSDEESGNESGNESDKEELGYNSEGSDDLSPQSGQGELDYYSDGSDEFSPQSDKIQNIVEYLNGFREIETDDIQQLATYINEAISIIKKGTRLISEQIKRNRVNFFSGHK